MFVGHDHFLLLTSSLDRHKAATDHTEYVISSEFVSFLQDTRPPSQNENELEAALAGLGVDGQVPTSGGMDDYIQATIKDALDKQEQNRQREMDDDFIPQPDSPVTASTYADDDDEDAEETDYFKLKKMKEFYPRKGDVQRLNAETFDEAVFAGEQEFTIIVFYAKFCKQCKYHAPSLRAAGRRYKNDPKVNPTT